MSEYQYYEFAALDRPLTPEEMAQLREASSRATITPRSFINEYHWGQLKGDPMDWMVRYFDAHVHTANWGSSRFMLRLPASALADDLPARFMPPPGRGSSFGSVSAFEAIRTPEHWILDWSFNGEPGENERFWSQAAGPGWMDRIVPVRDELLRGDTRSLYLGWLACLCNEELEEEDSEPPLPAGLNELSPAQSALAEFLEIDPDWLAAAAEASPPLPAREAEETLVDKWIETLSPNTMAESLLCLLTGRQLEAERHLRALFLDWRHQHAPASNASHPPRTVGELETRRQAAALARQARERQAQLEEEARRRRERAQHLQTVLQRSHLVWETLDKTLQRGSSAAYDEALCTLRDLADAYAQAGREAEFRRNLERFMASHTKRGAWITRLVKAGLWTAG